MAKSKKPKKPFNPFDEDTYPVDDLFAAGGRLRPPVPDDTEDDDEPPPPPPVWPDALDTFLEKYIPGTAELYNERLTTQEIQTMLVNHCGQAPRKPELVEELTKRGFSYAAFGSGLEWLLQKK